MINLDTVPFSTSAFSCHPGERIGQLLATLDNPMPEEHVMGIYITPHELGLEETLYVLERQPSNNSPSIHIGCGAWYNFDVICARKSDYSLIVDSNVRNRNFISITFLFLRENSSRVAFVNDVVNYLRSLRSMDAALYIHDSTTLTKINEELRREGSWLYTEENYAYIRQMAMQKRIVPIVEDITNVCRFFNIRTLLDQNFITIDSIYLSNLSCMMESKDQKDNFTKSVKELANDDTLVIHSQLEGERESVFKQSVLFGRGISHDGSNLFHA